MKRRMKIVSIVGGVNAVILALALWGGGVFAAEPQAKASGTASTHSTTATTSQPPAPVVLAARACTPTIAADDPHANFPPSMTPSDDQAKVSLTATQAAEASREDAGTFGTAPSASTAAATTELMSYGDYRALTGGPQESDVNTTRCVWVTTILADIQITRPAPPKDDPTAYVGNSTASSVTVALDEESGLVIEVHKGTPLLSNHS